MSLCSDCSVPVKPIVAIDIDGTLAEYHQALARHIVNYWGLLEAPKRLWDGQGNYEDFFGITQEMYREAKLAFRQGGFKRSAERMPGLLSLCVKLRELRNSDMVEVWITTTRPWNRLDSTDPDTRFWLDTYFPVYDHLLYHDDKYNELARIVDPRRVVAVVEDLPEMFMSAVRAFNSAHVPHLIRRPHNEYWRMNVAGTEWSPGYVSDLSDFAKIVDMKVNRYHERNQ